MSAAVEATPDAMTAPPALEVRGLRGGYGSTTVLRDIDLTVPRGSVAAIIGPNGAGKTTLLKTIAGVLRPSHGSIAMGGQDVTGLSAAKRHRLGACTIPEGRGVFRSLTVRENLQLQVPRGEEKRATELAVEAFPSLGRRMT
jgi:branched-chain amino acid transport system ATP-binding protein